MAEKSKYTKPKLRERIKNRIMAGSKGGKAGQWSARKAQMLAAAYKKAGGGYRGGKGKKQKASPSGQKKNGERSLVSRLCRVRKLLVSVICPKGHVRSYLLRSIWLHLPRNGAI